MSLCKHVIDFIRPEISIVAIDLEMQTKNIIGCLFICALWFDNNIV